MKMMDSFKYAGLAALVLTVAAGCATVQDPGAAESHQQARQAIDQAREAAKVAAEEGQVWRDTEKFIDEAEKALAAGDTGKALSLAQRAQSEAEMAAEQRRTEREAFRLAAAEGAGAEDARAAGDYTVRRGDSLWTISGRAEVYGNPYQWPLIYRTNRDQIQDADLIFPGQQFRIERNFGQTEVNAAVRHARTRGEWSLGVVEQSDQNYLRGR